MNEEEYFEQLCSNSVDGTLTDSEKQKLEEHLAELSRLEAERCPSMDQTADTFALLLQSAAAQVEDTVKRRVLEQMLYHLGRWIYLVDAADDLAKDFDSGDYNPLIYRYGLTEGKLTEEAQKSLVVSLDHSIRLMAAACELWDFGVWTPIIHATVYEGLFLVGQAVLEGTFQAADRLMVPGHIRLTDSPQKAQPSSAGRGEGTNTVTP